MKNHFVCVCHPLYRLYGGSKPNDGAAAKAASNELEARDR